MEALSATFQGQVAEENITAQEEKKHKPRCTRLSSGIITYTAAVAQGVEQAV